MDRMNTQDLVGNHMLDDKPIYISHVWFNGGNNYELAFKFQELNSDCLSMTFFADKKEAYTPEKIICSGNRTIVFWADGTKTIVKCGEDERDSLYHAFTAAVCKKLYGSNSAIHKLLKDKTLIQANDITVSKSAWDAAIKRLRELWERSE